MSEGWKGREERERNIARLMAATIYAGAYASERDSLTRDEAAEIAVELMDLVDDALAERQRAREGR